MDWVFLVLAGCFEIGWPLGLKWSQIGTQKWPGIAVAVVCMGLSGWLLWMAQKTIPIGTAYAVWTGIGAAGTFAVGLLFFGDSGHALRIASATLIIAGVIGLKVFH